MERSKSLSSPTLSFVEQVVVDGRYVEDLQSDPGHVARALSVDLSDESAREIRGADRTQLLQGLYQRKFSGPASHDGRHATIVAEKATAGFGGAIIVGIIVGIVVSAALALKKSSATPPPPPPPPPEGN